MTQKIRLYVGTYTQPEGHVPEAFGEGIYIFEMDPDTGALIRVGLENSIASPSFLAIAPNKRCLYAVSEVSSWPEGKVTAFAIDHESGALRPLNEQPAHGSSTAYVSVDDTGRVVMVANYGSGSVAVYPVDENGGLKSASDMLENHESPDTQATGWVADRQDGPHAHCIVTDPTNDYVMVCDLGLDKVYVHKRQNGQLAPHDPPCVQLPAGSGPRHIAFRPDKRFAYVVNELNSTVSVLAYNAMVGHLHLVQTISTLPDSFTGKSHCSDIHVSSSGRFVYAGNRGHNSISVFKVDDASGHLTLIDHQPTRGKTPRNFAIDPTGNFLLAANQDSHTIITLRIDQESGLLSDTGILTECPTPVCLKLVEV